MPGIARHRDSIGPGEPSALTIPSDSKVQNFFVLVHGLIGGEDVIESTILANDDDHVFDRRLRRALCRSRRGKRSHRVACYRANRGAGQQPVFETLALRILVFIPHLSRLRVNSRCVGKVET